MEILFEGKKNISILPSGVCVTNNIVENLASHDTLITSDDYLLLTIDEYCISYDLQITAETIITKPSQRLAVYLADITLGYDHHLTFLEQLGGAKFIIPFPTVDQMTAVDFCREVMMKRL
jgi:hypothetical protein